LEAIKYESILKFQDYFTIKNVEKNVKTNKIVSDWRTTTHWGKTYCSCRHCHWSLKTTL